jgi:hypothetical protein
MKKNLINLTTIIMLFLLCGCHSGKTNLFSSFLVATAPIVSSSNCSTMPDSKLTITDLVTGKQQLILSVNEVGLRLPTISPDGTKLAYIASKPQCFKSSKFGLEGNFGTESVWVINLDGSGNHKVSGDLQAALLRDEHNQCWEYQSISNFIGWSPDSKFIAFQHINKLTGFKEIHVVGTDKEVKYLIQDKKTETLAFTWGQSDHSFASTHNNLLEITTGDGILIIEPLPNKIDNIKNLHMDEANKKIYLSDTTTDLKRVTIWSFEYIKRVWDYKVIEKSDNPSKIEVSNNGAFFFNQDEVLFQEFSSDKDMELPFLKKEHYPAFQGNIRFFPETKQFLVVSDDGTVFLSNNAGFYDVIIKLPLSPVEASGIIYYDFFIN